MNEQKENMFKEIDIIQDIIKRMASNSFMIKGWTITLVVITLLLEGNNYQSIIAFIPLITFWILDASFLRQERLYRKLYKWVINNRLESDKYLFDMDTSRFENKVESKLRVMFSYTLSWFYGSICILLFVYIIYQFISTKGGV